MVTSPIEIAFGDLVLNVARSQIVGPTGEAVSLTPQIGSLLGSMMRRPEQTVLIESYLVGMYQYPNNDRPANAEKAVNVLMCSLRKSIIKSGTATSIKNVWGKGYAITLDAPQPKKPPRKSGVRRIRGAPAPDLVELVQLASLDVEDDIAHAEKAGEAFDESMLTDPIVDIEETVPLAVPDLPVGDRTFGLSNEVSDDQPASSLPAEICFLLSTLFKPHLSGGHFL